MEIKDLGSLAQNFLWVFLRGILQALGEQFPAQQSAIENGGLEGAPERVIMPLKLMLLRGFTVVSIAIGLGTLHKCSACENHGFGPNDVTKTRHSNDSLDRKENDEHDLGESNTPPQANSILSNWHGLPIYFFFLFSWAQSGLASIATAYLPLGDLGRHLLFIGIALLLCPVQFAATLASSYTAYSSKTTESTATREKPLKDSEKDSPLRKRTSRSATAVLLLRITVAMYSWLAPITLVWASLVEINKAGALKLSRSFSLAQYAIDPNLYYGLSASDIGIVGTELAGVLSLYVFIWVALTLPATIVLRRVHASQWFETLERAMRRETRAPKHNLPSYAAAWRSFARGPYRRLLAVYACGSALLLLVAVGGMQLCLMALANSDTSGYMGFWASLLLRLKMAAGMLF